MQGSKQLTLRRLQKEEHQLKADPIPGILVQRDGHLDFHFVIYNLDGEYKGGFYHGLLQLHQNYPFAAPKLFFFTKNGRFQINMPICTSFTNYHQQSWTSAWNVRSLLLGTVSFMTCNENSYGCRNDSVEVRRKYAADSLQENFKNQKFVELFRQQLQKLGISVPQKKQTKCLQLNESKLIEESLVEQQLVDENVNGVNRLQAPQNERRRRNGETRRKILIITGCGLAIGLIALTFYLTAN